MTTMRVALALSAVALIAAGCTDGLSSSQDRPTLPSISATSRPTYVPLPKAPKHVDFARLKPRINRQVPCGLLPIPGYYWETLNKPECWDEDFGNIHFYSEEYTFIVGLRTKNHAAYLIYNQPNEAIHSRELPGISYPVHFASVQATDLCLAPLGSSRIIVTFNWRTGRLTTGAVGRCS